MSHQNMKPRIALTQWLPVLLAAVALLLAAPAQAAAPGITGTLSGTTVNFSLTAQANYISQPDGAQIYSWGYGCASGFTPGFVPFPGNCSSMQVPGPTLVVTEGQTVTVTLTNSLPVAAGNTSILFPGFQVCAGTIANVSSTNPAGTCTPSATDGITGLMAQEAAPGGSVSYSFVATKAGTHSYYSGTRPDLQVEMGLYGALIVLPSTPATCSAAPQTGSFKLAPSAYDSLASTCYDREYLFQFAEIDPAIHSQAEQQAAGPGPMNVATEPYHPRYFLINGRSMPDDMDTNYAPNYPHQPYNGNPHMHPGDLVLLRVIGVGRWQHPFHEHGNHVRILGRDGNLLLSTGTDPGTGARALAGPLLFTTTTTPGLAMDGIFYWTGKGLGWDVYAHQAGDGSICSPDANGYYTVNSPSPAPANAPNYYEWCADHDKALETRNGGPATLPDANILTNGAWYGGSPYLGVAARTNAGFGPTPLPPGTFSQNAEAGFAYMWHSHNEREITTNDLFPGGMMMMMIVDPPVFFIDETQ